jgi:hypothetical protein
MQITETILREVFNRLLNVEPKDEVVGKLTAVVDGMMEKFQGTFQLDTVQRQNTFRAVVCSMIVHGWGVGMHPWNHPDVNLDGNAIDVRVSKDILVPIEHVKALRYVQKDEQGRVRKVLFEPDQDERVRGQVEKLLDRIAREKWGNE